MKLRRRKGAVLGLVAACAMMVVILGIGLFFLSKMFGGGREIAHATDSGILNVSKQLMDSPTVSAAGTDFVACGYPANSQAISLYSYNKCVGQAMLVALNAKASGSTVAGTHAKTVYDQLVSKIETPLKLALTAGSGGGFNYQQAFNNLSNMNSTRMSGNAQLMPGYEVSYMRGGTSNPNAVASSNLFFNLTASQQITTSGANAFPACNTQGTYQPPTVSGNTYTSYVDGYKPIPIEVPGNTLTFMTVPVFPSQAPHLVSYGDFKNSASPPQDDVNIPPNAVKISARAVDSTANALTGAVSCAIVGAIDEGYAASIPAGYIEIFNRPGTSLTGYAPVDNGNNIFNNEMFATPGVSLNVNGSSAIFSCATDNSNNSLMDKWAAYNANPVGQQQPPTSGHSGNGNPAGQDDAIFIANTPGQAGSATTQISDLRRIRKAETTNCSQMLATSGFLTGNCLSWMSTVAKTYNRQLPNNTGTGTNAPQDLSTMGTIFSNVDYMKVTVLQQFQSRVQAFGITAPMTPKFPDNHNMDGSTGMGVYNVSNPSAIAGMTYATPENKLPITQPYSPLGFLQQIDAELGANGCGASGSSNILAQITQRCQQIQPTVTAAQVKALLDSNRKMAMGTKFYIYLPGADQTATGPYGGLVMDQGGPQSLNGGPVGYNGSNPAVCDGTPVNPVAGQDPAHNCQGGYQLLNTMVNVPRNPPQLNYPAVGTPITQGDDNVHYQPYTITAPGSNLQAVDHALWQDSSGYGNLLGHLEFANTVTGGAMFSAPN